jgi:hypothetical protein
MWKLAPKAQEREVTEMDRKLQGTVWVTVGCKSWYIDKAGRNASIWPRYMFIVRSCVLSIRLEDYEFRQSSKQEGFVMHGPMVSCPLLRVTPKCMRVWKKSMRWKDLANCSLSKRT